MADKKDEPAAPEDNPSGEGLGARVDQIEHEQQRQGGVLDRIVGMLGGTDSPPEPDKQADPLAGPDPGDVAEQMRQAVRDVRAEEAAKEHDAHHAQLKNQPTPETPPAEVMVRGKQRLQKWLIGSEPK